MSIKNALFVVTTAILFTAIAISDLRLSLASSDWLTEWFAGEPDGIYTPGLLSFRHESELMV